MKKLWALVLAGCIAVVLSTTAWAGAPSTSMDIVTNEADLIDRLANHASTSIRLDFDIEVSSTLVVEKNVTLDLNGHMLRLKEGKSGSVIHVKSGTLTLVDEYDRISAPPTHRFTVGGDGLWTLRKDGDTGELKTVVGGVITGGKGGSYKCGLTAYNDCGGGVFVAPGASFVMEGGNIVGCSGDKEYSDGGGGVFVSDGGEFKMIGGTISGCVASRGGGLCNHGTATLTSTAKIESCRATGTGSEDYGGGVCSFRNLTISGKVEITGCKATKSESAAMYVNQADVATSSIKGGTFDGNVLFYKNSGGNISVSGGTFNDEVTFNNNGDNGSVSVSGGTFNGKVMFENNGDDNNDTLTVSGGTFNGDVSGVWTVTFNADGGTPVPEPQIRANLPATKPSEPTKDGFDFGGWYTDEALTTEYKFTEDEKVTQNMTLKAKWAEKQEPVAEQPKYYYKASGSGETTETKGSPKTFDAGVGVYVGMAVLSVSGMAWTTKKRR